MKINAVRWISATLAVVLILPVSISWAAMRDLTVGTGLALRYDDNVFQYSNRDLNRFDNSKAKFGSLISEDDLILNPSVSMGYRFRHKKYDARITLEADAKLHDQNTIRNYQVYTFRANQELPGRSSLRFRYLLVPRFFLRPLSLATGPGYADAEMKIQSFKLDLDKDFTKWLTGELSGLFEKKDYNTAFDERDTDVVGGGAEVRLRLIRGVRVAVGADYEKGTASGENDPVFNSDISYNQTSFHVHPTARLTKKVTADVGYSYDSKHYITDLAADRNHYHRNDFTNTWKFRMKGRLFKRLDAYIDHERINRSSNTPEVSAEFAAFGERRTTVGLDFEL